MKALTFTLTIFFMSLFCNAQKIVYDDKGKKHSYENEELDIHFEPGKGVVIGQADTKNAAGLIGLLPTIVDAAFKITTKMLENRAKKFTAEYSKQKSYIDAYTFRDVPNFSFVRTLNDTGAAINMRFRSYSAGMGSSLAYYSIDTITLNKSAAKSTAKSNVFDYTIELKLTILVKGEMKLIELAPLVISSVHFGPNPFPKNKHRTALFVTPQDAIITDIAVKIVETNPAQVRAEKILGLWNDQKDNAKTIINNYLPKGDADKSGTGGASDAKSNTPGKPAGN